MMRGAIRIGPPHHPLRDFQHKTAISCRVCPPIALCRRQIEHGSPFACDVL
jgi:hypothetical protein